MSIPGQEMCAAVLAAAERTGLFRAGEPVAVILALILHFLDFGTAHEVAAELTHSIAPGSYVVMSVSAGDERTSGAPVRDYTAGTLYNHSPRQIAEFFGGLELVGPGLVDARDWTPTAGSTALPASPHDGRILAGVGRKPPRRTSLLTLRVSSYPDGGDRPGYKPPLAPPEM